ncbi:MAG: type IV pilus assembly protein PilM, type IV pilus assembly protein PilM [Parcubacteria group bacterium GW2011_GWC1_43_12]|nr:MAG: Type IV pilus assembly protein PilM [Parcubacteria group bacterium GW2011_GWB1_42_6]KKS91307.1 MAG: type IV pilus assembly protein PilM, type IV pilus assembly protein PilM [Parcubacteria group bacterium GW2011_GWC1_43_12]
MKFSTISFLNPKITQFGIDLSDISIKIAQLKKTKKGYALSSFGRKEIAKGLIEEGEIKNEEKLVETIKEAVKEVKGETIKTPYCAASLPETESFVEVIRMPAMEKKEMAEAIKWEIEAHIPLSQEEIYYDWQIIGREPDHFDVIVGALPKKTVDPYLDVLIKAGLKPMAFEIESIATARTLIKKGESGAFLVIDIGAKKTSLAIASNKSIFFTTSISFSNISFTAALADSLNISFEEAKKIKMEKGLDDLDPKSRIFQTARLHFAELIAKIKECLDYYTDRCSASRKEKIDKIMICGGGANLSGLALFLSRELEMPAEIGNPLANVELINSVIKIPEEELSSYATALGLALE